MTEAEWLTSTDLAAMLAAVRSRASERKMRLFACACCDRIAHRLEDGCSRSALAAVRRAADGRADEAELTREVAAARGAMFTAARRVIVARFGEEEYDRARQRHRCLSTGPADAVFQAAETDPWFQAAHAVVQAASTVHTGDAFNVAQSAAEAAIRTGELMHAVEYRAAMDRERAAQCELLRDLFGKPCRPMSFDAAWRTTAAIGVAQTIYDLHRFADLPILADVLEETGCTDQELLDHCRCGGAHVRGCWAVDSLLGKS